MKVFLGAVIRHCLGTHSTVIFPFTHKENIRQASAYVEPFLLGCLCDSLIDNGLVSEGRRLMLVDAYRSVLMRVAWDPLHIDVPVFFDTTQRVRGR